MVRQQRSRGWSFTLHSFFPNHVLRLRALVSAGSRTDYVIFGREVCPTTSRRHLQGYLHLTAKGTMDYVKSLLGDDFRTIHLEPSKGTGFQNRKYCSKDGDFEEYGICPSQGRRSDLNLIQAKIKEGVSEGTIADEHFSQWVVYRRSFAAYRDLLSKPVLRPELRVFALIGAPGIGKTRYAFNYARRKQQDAWIAPDPELKWFDGYRGEDCAILDDYRGDGQFVFLLRLLDIYPLRVPIKGGFTQWIPTRIFITSNKMPEAWHIDQDFRALNRRIIRTIDVDSGPHAESYAALERYLDDIVNEVNQ